MSNHPNMSYCAFENTSAAVNQLIRMVSDAIDNDEPLDLNRYEKGAYDNLRAAMEVITQLMDEHDTAFKENDEPDVETDD